MIWAVDREGRALSPDHSNIAVSWAYGVGHGHRRIPHANTKQDRSHLGSGESGSALAGKGAWDGAITGCRETIRLKIDLALAHENLGLALWSHTTLAQ